MKVVFTFLCLFFVGTILAQNHPKLSGTWEGKLNVGVVLRLVFVFNDSAGIIRGTSYSPDQGNQPIPCSDISLKGDSINFSIPSLNVTFAGIFSNDSIISGKLTQGKTFDLILLKVLKPSELHRPQTPHPPYSYRIEEVEYDNADKSLHYGATLSIPPGKGPFPALLLITGSGPQNRDEEIFGHKPFAVIADHLTKDGFAVLRVDDRGVGKSTGQFSTSTSADFAADVQNSLNYLKSRKEIDIKRMGMLGHSEGGMIAPLVASQRNDINFIVLLAAPGEKILKLMQEQNIAVLKSSGISKEAAESYGDLFGKMMSAVIETKNMTAAKEQMTLALNDWIKITSKNIVTLTTGITNDSTQQQFLNGLGSSFSYEWLKYFLQFDPADYLKKLHCKVLALNGDKDLQVSSKSNLEGIRNALKESQSPSYDVKEIPGLNHLFQNCKTCTISEYGELEETFYPKVLDMISEWLNKNVR